MCKITIFTPLYNRGYCIRNLYESIINQSFDDFEWVVVNDGSIDNSDEIMQFCIQEDKISITYLNVENGGKHRAINKGLDVARGELFFIVDSDDTLPNTALERIMYWQETISKEEMFAGVSGNRGDKYGKLIGESFNQEYLDCTVLQREENHIIGDKAEVFYTALLKKYPFPEFENENFISESAVWLKLGKDGYKIRWFNEIIYNCDYLADGLTAQGNLLFQKNPEGFLYTILLEMQCFPNDSIKKMKMCVSYYITMKKVNMTLGECAHKLNVSKVYLLLACCLYKLKNIGNNRASL